jgi:integrase
MSKNGSKKRQGIFERVKGSGIWSICYFDARGRRHREVIGSKQDAIDAYADRKADIRKGRQFAANVRAVRVSALIDDLLRKYRLNSKSRWGHNVEHFCWKLHLRPFFGRVRAAEVTTDLLNQYVDERRAENNRRGQPPSSATINRELAVLRSALNLGRKSSPPRVFQVPPFPMLKEQNVRRGFVRDEHYDRLAGECAREGRWLRALVAVAYNYGFRRGELLNLCVRQVDLAARTIDLEPGTTKNDDARIVVMTQEVFQLLRACIRGKGPDDFVFTRDDGRAIGEFRKTWQNVCIRAGLGRRICERCDQEIKKAKCEKCGTRDVRYVGLILHDLRRTSCRNLRRLGISEKTIMKIGGWKTSAMFQRYDIVDQADLDHAARLLDEKRMTRIGSKAKNQPVGTRDPRTQGESSTRMRA